MILASRAQLRASLLRWTLFVVPIVLLLGFLSGQAAGSSANNPWFAALVKPAIYPPPATFGIVWSALYLMMGLAMAMVCAAWGARGRGTAITVFVIQLLLNLLWSPLFFALHQIKASLILIGVIDVAVLLTVLLFWRVRWQAGALLLPYLAWVLFATLLNWQFMAANPNADGMDGSGAVQRVEM